jgi:hypothetical protein
MGIAGLGSFAGGIAQGYQAGQQMIQQKQQLKLAQQKQDAADKQARVTNEIDIGVKMMGKDMPQSMRQQGAQRLAAVWKQINPDSDVSSLENLDFSNKHVNEASNLIKTHWDKVKKGEETLSDFQMITRSAVTDMMGNLSAEEQKSLTDQINDSVTTKQKEDTGDTPKSDIEAFFKNNPNATWDNWVEAKKSLTNMEGKNQTEEQLINIVNTSKDPNEKAIAAKNLSDLQQRKVDIAKASGAGRAQGYGDIRQITVIDTKDNNQMYTMTASDFKDANDKEPGRYLDSGKAQATLTKQALLSDIQGAIDNSRNSINNLKTDFDEKTRLLLYKATQSSNPSGMISNLINGELGKVLTTDQIDYLTDLQQLTENAMAMRSVLGAGQGSDQLRDAIKATIPNKGTFSKEMALSQINKFEQQLNRLSQGVAGIKLANPKGNISSSTTKIPNNAQTGTYKGTKAYTTDGKIFFDMTGKRLN